MRIGLCVLLVLYVVVAETGSLQSVIQNDDLQFVFLGGKGGVGKTTVSSAFAIRLAEQRKAKGPVLLISTDPAHSLSDAFEQEFDGTPQAARGIEGLFVMEIDPQVQLQQEIKSWNRISKDGGFDLAKEIEQFQSWITSMPGIDEATALASVIQYIEKGKYSAIVFDTAPTGHTLKLLQFPEIMQAGLDQLSSWQGKLWGYYNMFKGFMGGKDKNSDKLKNRVEKKLKDYKAGIEKVGKMLKNQKKTTFIAVCIAESLSISETQRLVQQLDANKIHSSHIVVNQLITAPQPEEIQQIQSLNADGALSPELVTEIQRVTQLVHSRHTIQQKYIHKLYEFEPKRVIVEVPLLNSELTGYQKLKDFSLLLVNPQSKKIKEKDDL